MGPPIRAERPVILVHELRRMLGSRREIDRRCRAGDLVHLHRGAYATNDGDLYPEERYRLRVAAYVRQRREAGEDPLLAGPAAVALRGLPSFGTPPEVVHVGDAGRGGRALRGLARPVSGRGDPEPWRVDGARLAHPARAVLDTARLRSPTSGVVAADAALRHELVVASELDRAVSGMRGLRNVAAARLCAALANPLSESPGESRSAVVLHLNDVPAPQRQHVVADEKGPIGRVDFWWPRRGVVGEYDGRVKYGRRNPSGRSPEDVLWEEKRREDRLRALGLTVVRWTAADLDRPDALCARLRGLVG